MVPSSPALARSFRIAVSLVFALAALAYPMAGSAAAAGSTSSFDGAPADPAAGRAADSFAKLLPRSTARSEGARVERQVVSPSLSPVGDHLTAFGTLGAPTIATVPARGFVLDSARGPVQIAPAWTAAAAAPPGALLDGAAAVFPGVAAGVDALLRPTAAGVATLLRLDGTLAAQSYSWTVATPVEHRVRLLSDGSAAVVAQASGPAAGSGAARATAIDDDDVNDPGDQYADARAAERAAESELHGADVLAIVAPPRAEDSKGRAIPTHLEVAGDVVTLVVEHRRGTTSYGAVAELDVSNPDAIDRPWVDAPSTGPSQRGADGLVKVLLRNGEVLVTHGADPRPHGADDAAEGDNPIGDGAAGGPVASRAPNDPDADDEGAATAAGTGPPYLCGNKNQQRIVALYGGEASDLTPATVGRIRSVLVSMNNKLYDESVASGGRDDAARYRFECDRDGQIAVDQFVPYDSDFESVVVAAKDSGFRDPDAKYVIFSEGDDPDACGEANQYPDDRASKDNLANDGSFNATYSGPTPAEGTYAIAYGRFCWQVDVAMHENAHTMGAVSDNSPESSGRGHCDDGYDVMCYDDRFEESQPKTYRDDACPLGNRGMHFDCDYNTYFDTQPERGEWLDSHWNLGDPDNLALGFSAAKPYVETFLFTGSNQEQPGVYRGVQDKKADASRVVAPACEGCLAAEPALSPDAQAMVFVQDTVADTTCASIFWSRVDGTDRRTLWDCHEEGTTAFNPEFAGSNAKLVFECSAPDSNGDYGICSMNTEGEARGTIADWPGHQVQPSEAGHRRLVAFASAGTPEGDQFGFDLFAGQRYQVFITKRDGTAPVQFTTDDEFVSARNPKFSHDGSRVAFEAWQAGESLPSVWVANVDGSGLQRLTSGFEARSPGWTPDDRVVYMAYDFASGTTSLVQENPETGSTTNLVSGWNASDEVAFRQPAYWQIGFHTPVPGTIP
ncbi:MAG TPA: hypothetical protein VF520_04945 [Thermoleophilaceae bacterium]|jgi:hypothetical protein